MKQDYEVIIIGSGFGGQLAALNLTRQGITNFLVLERRSFMGGTWSQNIYPGAAAWKDYPRAYLGTAAPGFPNLFIVTGPNTGIGHTSALFLIESQMRYIRK